ncbi:MAG TPA: hypothetical protein VKM72_30695 [Thermoanaerobaculia bacterium]|nr:hypothetical protein [Thermoanaerobaculia bacterium]
MSKNPSIVLTLALASLAGIAPASAETFWVPSPLTGAGNPKIHLETSDDGARRIEIAFVDTGDSAVGLKGSRVDVDNDEKPNVFNMTRYVNGPGMIRLTNDPGPNIRSGSMFLSTRNDDLAWPVPIVTNDNWFQGDEIAYIQNLARNTRGHANIEIMNLGTQTAVCTVELLRPKGTSFGSPLGVTLQPLSHEVVEDPFKDLVATGGGMRAEVHCNEPFYAYGTFVGASVAQFRMLYPLSVPPQDVIETLVVNRPGVFFAPVQGNSGLDVVLPLVENRAYRKVTIDFDVNISKFTPIFTGLVGMLHAGGPRFGKTLYFGTFIRGARNKTLVDLGSPVVEPALRVYSPWKQNALHHVMVVYDAEAATTRMLVTRDGKVIMDAWGGAYNLDIADRGAPVRVSFGLNGVADNAYFPPIGWKFSNLKILIAR